MSGSNSKSYCGRLFTPAELEMIRELIAADRHLTRAALSRLVCDELGWVRPDGRRKDMSCRVAMLRMHRDGLLVLPPPTKRNGNGHTRPRPSAATAPEEAIGGSAGELGPLEFKLVGPADTRLWNELIERYHYLGYKPLPGAQLRYFVFAAGRRLAALGFAAAAWKAHPRDAFIGWTPQERARNLHLIVNNARFLILPWVRCPNLATRILGHMARLVPHHWQTHYGYRPVLLETFCEQDRFRGTCYRAANWIHLGLTQGRGKLDRYKRYALPIKAILVYPLTSDFRAKLCTPP
ncbi:MAG: Druantia anti-phage system protein DruA [Planctomycetota bacterium]